MFSVVVFVTGIINLIVAIVDSQLDPDIMTHFWLVSGWAMISIGSRKK